MARDKSAIWYGLFFVMIAGVAREYDQESLLQPAPDLPGALARLCAPRPALLRLPEAQAPPQRQALRVA